MGRLAGKITVVTGAARGLGRAVALAFAQEGAVVHALDLFGEELASLAALHPAIRPWVVDLAQDQPVLDLFAAIETEAGRIDTLVNNAGVIFFKPVEEVSLSDWTRLIDINLRAVFLGCKAVAPGMKARRSGSIINVSSNAGVEGGVDESTYCAAKFGLEGLSRALALEFAPYGVAVNSITPGHPMRTAMSEITYPAELRKIWKDPAELAPAFVHLAQQTAEGITNRRLRAWDLVQDLQQG